MSSLNDAANSALVPKPPWALEKGTPGAERILTDMVADTLALVKKEQATKPVISVAMCGWADSCLQEMPELLLRDQLAHQSSVEFKFFFWTTDFLEAARHSQFDLFILLLNPASYSRKATAEYQPTRELHWEDHGDEIDAYELIAKLKREFHKPVFVISNGMKYGSNAELVKAGADAVCGIVFGVYEFRSALQKCLKFSVTRPPQPEEITPQPRRTRPLRIVILDDEPFMREFYSMFLVSLCQTTNMFSTIIRRRGRAE